MGLLQKAATAATIDDAKTLETEAPAVPAPARKRAGLLQRSMQALVAEPPSLAVELAPEPAGEPAPELQPERTPVPAPEQAVEPLAELTIEPVSGLMPELTAELTVDLEPVPELMAEPSPELVPEPTIDLEPVPEPSPEPPEPSFEPIREPAPEPTPATVPQPAPQMDVEGTIQEIVASIRALPDGVELPSQLFTLLATRLSIQKGALLLYDPLRLVYAPWASQGYDQTTLHKMRIPLGANESWNALANGAPLVLADPASTSIYQQYFSARESSSLMPMFLTPFIADSKLVGVLLITNLASPFENDEQTLRCLSTVAEAGSPRVQAARGERLEKAGAQGMRAGESPEEEASHYLGAFKSAGTKILFLSLSLEEYAQKIIASHKHLDPFRLHEDLHYFLGTFVSDLGKAISIKQYVSIVALQDFDASQLDLFRHQLSLYLHGLFGGNGQGGADTVSGIRIRKTQLWPTEDGDIAKLLDFLSS
jgi:hypothetical protein